MKKIAVLATGGTIAGTGEKGKTTGYHSGILKARELIASVPGIERLADLSCEQTANVDSCDMSWELWLKLAHRIKELEDEGLDGIVITHGTDTLEETAFFLSLTTASQLPVVLTGSMRPATALSADGPLNLFEAVAVAASEEARGRGPLVLFSDLIYSARDVQKVSTFRAEAFSGRDFGCLGYVRDGCVSFYSKAEAASLRARQFSPFTLPQPGTAAPSVEIAPFFAGAGTENLRWLLQKADGLVIAGAGCGGISQEWLKVLTEENSRSVPVALSSRIANGTVIQNEEWPAELFASGLLSPQKARILLLLALLRSKELSAVIASFKAFQ